MSEENYIQILHELAKTNISSAGFTCPTEYLIWFLKEIDKLFDQDDKLIFANIQFIPLRLNNSDLISNGRLKDIPTLVNVENIPNEDFRKLSLEVFSFLLASNLIEEKPFGNVLSLLKTYKDKFIIEVAKVDNNENITEPIKFDDRNRILSIYIPDYFDANIAEKYFSAILDNKYNGIRAKFDSRLIIDDKNFVDAFGKVMMSNTKDKYIGEIGKFFGKTYIKEITEKYRQKLDTFDKTLAIEMSGELLDQFVKMIFVHSWLKSMRCSYQITIAKFDHDNEPSSFGVFLITSQNKLSIKKLNLLHIALNIAFNNIFDFLSTNNNMPVNEIDQGKTITSRVGKTPASFSQLDSIQFLYKDPKMRGIDYEISKYARLDVPVLITGETGVGKDLVAYLIHRRSPRMYKEFVRIPIKNLAESLIESELFGYEKGAFTGASERKIGKLEGADAGTVYLPEISELSKNTQLKLLEFLQYQTIDRVGGGANLKRKLDLRLIFATNENLEDLVVEGKIRPDFYYRIKVAAIHLPPLRERKEDIVLLANFFLEKYSQQMLGQKYTFENETIDLLKDMEWKGNVRELENTIIRAIIVSSDNRIGIEAFKDLRINYGHTVNGRFKIQSLHQAEKDFKKEYFKNIINHANGNISKAAQIAGISRQNFYRIMKELEL
jgi:DNA-binding NtrC family response regulator